jgi:dCTP deaminase
MAEQEGMIEPFAPDQIRMDGDRRLISYGTSSYGYDVRCSREFKVFTNIHSATVDPKHFDEDSFVHVEGDVCVIPPNSFALACTVEYFAFRAMCSPFAWANRPMRAAASSLT